MYEYTCNYYYFFFFITIFCRYTNESDWDGSSSDGTFEGMKEHLLETIKNTFKVSPEQALQLYSELLQCTRKKNLVSCNANREYKKVIITQYI